MTYAKLIDGQLHYPPVIMQRGGATIVGYDKDQAMLVEDGYLPVVELERTSDYGAFVPRVDGDRIVLDWVEGEAPDPLGNYAGVLQSFAALWASLGVGALPSDWTEAMGMLEGVPADVQIKLLAYRVALAPVWDTVLERMARHA